jgi:hypothetical protein
MTQIDARRLKRFERPDGDAAVDIYRRNDGLHQFIVEEQKAEEDGPHDGDRYWLPTYTSGFYESAADVEREAVRVVPWLQSLLNT